MKRFQLGLLAVVMGLELVMMPFEAVLENGVLPESGGFRFRIVKLLSW